MRIKDADAKHPRPFDLSKDNLISQEIKNLSRNYYL
jgi:hypothetical protein